MSIQKIQYLTDFVFCLYELFPAFICANNTGRTVNSLFGGKIFNLFPYFTSSLSSRVGMSDASINSSSKSSTNLSLYH